MNRLLLVWSLALFTITNLYGQAPKGINYQGVARDNEGKPIASKTISVRISILKNSGAGELEFAEVHKPQTNQFGLFTLVIGQGTVESGNFGFVSWAVGSKWLQIEIDPDGNSSFMLAGSQQLMSVPYAFYSEYSGNGLTAGNGIAITNNQIHNTGDGDSSPTNEVITEALLTTDGKLRLTEAGTTKEVDLSPLAGGFLSGLEEVLNQGNNAAAQRITNLGAPVSNSDAATKGYVDAHTDGDASVTNEIQDLTFTGNLLRVTNNSQATSIDLSPLLDNTDGQTLTLTGTNLAISNGNLVDLSTINTDSQNLQLGTTSGTQRTINISNGTGVTIDVADNDNSSTNEIQDLNLLANTLRITNNPAAAAIDLSPYAQSLQLSGNTLSISNGNSINLSSVNTDNQNLQLGTISGTNRTINISNGTGVTIDVADNDNSSTNEIQTISKTGATVALNLGGGSITLNDDSNTNEIQDLSLIGNTLRITDNPAATAINLNPYLDNTDSQTLSLAGSNLSITNGNLVNLSGINTDNQSLTLGTPSGTNRTINITNGTGVTIDVADLDNNPTNEIQTLSLNTGTNALGISGVAPTVDLTPYRQTLTVTPATNNLSISGGNAVILPTLAQLLTFNANAGGTRIQNIGTPSSNTDATTKGYVDTSIATAIATNYSFKTNFNFQNTGGSYTDSPITLMEDFDDFNVVGSNRFTAPSAGVYSFTVTATSNLGGVPIRLKVTSAGTTYFDIKRQQAYPVVTIINYQDSMIYKLNAGDTVELVVTSLNLGERVEGFLFGYKL